MTRGTLARALLTGAVVVAAGALVALQWPRLRAQDVRAREQAYRLNNIGVARLEQYDYKAAADTFRQALASPGSPVFARLNLALALYYDNQLDDAEREARAAATAQPNSLRACASSRPTTATSSTTRIFVPAKPGSSPGLQFAETPLCR